VTEASALFVDLLDATMRSCRNYHRLDHCSHVDGSSPKSVFRFKEETITDLLIGELAGRESRCQPTARSAARAASVATGTAIPPGQ
jgi:hypothetical protein